jgi:hypothetical protein
VGPYQPETIRSDRHELLTNPLREIAVVSYCVSENAAEADFLVALSPQVWALLARPTRDRPIDRSPPVVTGLRARCTTTWQSLAETAGE